MNFNIRKDANGIEVISPLPHKIIMLMPIFQFFHKNKPSIKSTYLGFVLFSGRQIQRFAVGEILWSIYTEIIPGEEPSRVVTVLGRGLRGTLWTLLQFYCHVIFSSAGGTDYLANFRHFIHCSNNGLWKAILCEYKEEGSKARRNWKVMMAVSPGIV